MVIASTIKFLAVVAFFGFIVVGVTLLWPKFSSKPRPEVLRRVHELTLGTKAGREAADVLGVSDEREITAVNLSDLSAQIVLNVSNTVKEGISGAIYRVTTSQINKLFRNLPEEEKAEVRSSICQTEATN